MNVRPVARSSLSQPASRLHARLLLSPPNVSDAPLQFACYYDRFVFSRARGLQHTDVFLRPRLHLQSSSSILFPMRHVGKRINPAIVEQKSRFGARLLRSCSASDKRIHTWNRAAAEIKKTEADFESALRQDMGDPASSKQSHSIRKRTLANAQF
jgi:hypothetical protein